MDQKPTNPWMSQGREGLFDVLLGFSEGAACGTMLVAAMQGAGKASCVELKEELSDVAWLEQTWQFQ